MRRRELWGLALVVLGAVALHWAAYGPALRPERPDGTWLLVHVWGVTQDTAKGLIGLLGGVAGSVGFVLAAASLIGRIPRTGVRWTTGTLAALVSLPLATYVALSMFLCLIHVDDSLRHTFRVVSPDGQEVLLQRAPFEPQSISVFTRYDHHLYQLQQRTRLHHASPDTCHLEAAGENLTLVCGDETTLIRR